MTPYCAKRYLRQSNRRFGTWQRVFEAVDPLKPAHYTLAGSYFCPGIKRGVRFIGYSKLGVVVLRSSEIEGDGMQTYLHIVKLPEPEEQ